MFRFSDLAYDDTTQTARIGAGLIWDEAYAALEPHGVNVAGGRVSGIGVAGFTLGGGRLVFMYSQAGAELTGDHVSAHAVTRVLLARESIRFDHRHGGGV